MIEAPEAPHHHHHKTGIPWFDLIMPLAVLCISIGSLLTSLQSEKSMHALVEENRRLVDAQSTPLLMLDSGNNEDGKKVVTLTLSNVGTGPARISWFRVVDADGHDFSGNAITLKATQLGNPLIGTEQIDSTLMRSGDSRSVFSWPKPESTNRAAAAEWDRVEQARFHIHASACYCSIFDECRTTEFGNSRPKRVDSCEVESPDRKQ